MILLIKLSLNPGMHPLYTNCVSPCRLKAPSTKQPRLDDRSLAGTGLEEFVRSTLLIYGVLGHLNYADGPLSN